MSKIAGRVIDYSTDDPVLGVLVQITSQNNVVTASTTTDSAGNWQIDNSSVDDLYSKISFAKDGYATQTMRPTSANDVDVVLPRAGTLASVTLTLKQNPKRALLYALIGAVAVYLVIKYKNQLKF